MSEVFTFCWQHSDLRTTLADPSQLRAKPEVSDLKFGHIFTDHMLKVFYHKQLGGWQKPVIIPFENISLHPAAKVLHYAIEVSPLTNSLYANRTTSALNRNKIEFNGRSSSKVWRRTGASTGKYGSSGRTWTWTAWTSRRRVPACPPSTGRSWSSAWTGWSRSTRNGYRTRPEAASTFDLH